MSRKWRKSARSLLIYWQRLRAVVVWSRCRNSTGIILSSCHSIVVRYNFVLVAVFDAEKAIQTANVLPQQLYPLYVYWKSAWISKANANMALKMMCQNLPSKLLWE